MEWNNDEQENIKKGMALSSKILLAIIACIVLIIILLIILLMSSQSVTTVGFKIIVNGAQSNINDINKILTTVDNQTYVNIKEFAKLVGYEYHEGEYKAAVIEENKCYVEGTAETSSFYLNDNKIYKLPTKKLEEEYKEIELDNTIKQINQEMYAPLEGISKAFNVVLQIETNYLQVYTLDYLVGIYDANVKELGYVGIAEQNLENQKSLLYGYLIVNKEGGLYKVIDANNDYKEVILDKYNKIVFSEATEEFFVTDSSEKVGVLNLNGTTKIEPVYEEVSILTKDLYLVKLSSKYGVVNENGNTVVYPDYDKIGLNNTNIKNENLILDTLIPVSKSNKWGAYNKNGEIVLPIEYDGFGYDLNSIEIDGIKEVVDPILEIERCNGFVVKKSNKYGLISVEGEELVPIAVDGIYGIKGENDENSKYYMLYNGEELNVIQRLITAGKIKENVKEDDTTNVETNNTIENVTITDTNINNNID